MKRRDLIKKLENGGFVFERHGSNHDVYARGEEKEEVPRHKEIDERLAKAIYKAHTTDNLLNLNSIDYSEIDYYGIYMEKI